MTDHWAEGDVLTNGIRMHYYRTGGDKPPLVLAHGFSDNGLCWSPVARVLQADYDVIMIDARNHGKSEAPATAGGSRAQGDDLAGLIRALKLEEPAVMGHSMGGGATLQAGQVLVIPGGEKPYVPKPTPTPRPAPTRAPAQAPAAPVQVPSASGSLLWPMQGVISQGYWVAQYASHRAIDIAAPTGTPIYAAENGVVTHVQWNLWPYGTMVMVTHDNGMKTLYAHMSALNVANGQTVSKGDQLGACGSTGRSTGPHVHFEVIRNGAQVNPLLYLP